AQDLQPRRRSIRRSRRRGTALNDACRGLPEMLIPRLRAAGKGGTVSKPSTPNCQRNRKGVRFTTGRPAFYDWSCTNGAARATNRNPETVLGLPHPPFSRAPHGGGRG